MTVWPTAEDFDTGVEWERQPGEPSKAYAAFRMYRDMMPYERATPAVAKQINMTRRQVDRWMVAWRWQERASAWDDACHRLEDQERLESIRQMHNTHRHAAQRTIQIALQAMGRFDPDALPPGIVVRMLELGTKLERSTLLTSVEEMQGVEAYAEDDDDPWERIARELDPRQTKQEQ